MARPEVVGTSFQDGEFERKYLLRFPTRSGRDRVVNMDHLTGDLYQEWKACRMYVDLTMGRKVWYPGRASDKAERLSNYIKTKNLVRTSINVGRKFVDDDAGEIRSLRPPREQWEASVYRQLVGARLKGVNPEIDVDFSYFHGV